MDIFNLLLQMREADAQRSKVTSPGPDSWQEAEPGGSEPGPDLPSMPLAHTNELPPGWEDLPRQPETARSGARRGRKGELWAGEEQGVASHGLKGHCS